MNLPPPDFADKGKPVPVPSTDAPNRATAVPSLEKPAPAPLAVAPAYSKTPPRPKPPEWELDLDSWPSLLKDTLAYPWRNHGWMILLPGGFLGLVMAVTGWSFLGLVTLVLIGGYLAAHYFNVVETTTTGRMVQPEWPEISNVWSDVVEPGFQVYGVTLISLLPGILLHVFLGREPEFGEWPQLLTLAIHSLYFPMAMIATALHGTLSAAFPHRVLPAILRAAPGYWIGALLLWLLSAALLLVTELLAYLPVAGLLLSFCAMIYHMTVHGRFCGLLYRRFADRIGW